MRESAYIAEIDLKALRPVYGKVPTFAPISRFAKETRDLALVMSKSVTCGEVEKAIAEAKMCIRDRGRAGIRSAVCPDNGRNHGNSGKSHYFLQKSKK